MALFQVLYGVVLQWPRWPPRGGLLWFAFCTVVLWPSLLWPSWFVAVIVVNSHVNVNNNVRRQNVYSDLNEIWSIRRGRWVLHDTMVYCMTRSKVKLKVTVVTVVWNIWKWPISKAVYSANMHVIKILAGNFFFFFSFFSLCLLLFVCLLPVLVN